MEFANADSQTADLRIFILSIHWMSDNIFPPVQYHEFHMTIHSFYHTLDMRRTGIPHGIFLHRWSSAAKNALFSQALFSTIRRKVQILYDLRARRQSSCLISACLPRPGFNGGGPHPHIPGLDPDKTHTLIAMITFIPENRGRGDDALRTARSQECGVRSVISHF